MSGLVNTPWVVSENLVNPRSLVDGSRIILGNHGHPDARLWVSWLIPFASSYLEDAEVLLGQLPEIHSLIRLEEEGELATVPLIFCVHYLHWKPALGHLLAADQHRVVLVAQLFDHAAITSAMVLVNVLTLAPLHRRWTW